LNVNRNIYIFRLGRGPRLLPGHEVYVRLMVDGVAPTLQGESRWNCGQPKAADVFGGFWL